MEDWKIKIAVLWIAQPVLFLIYFTMETSFFGSIEVDTPVRLLAMTLVLALPLIMAFGSITLKDKLNSWVNIVGGILFFGGLFYGVYNEVNSGVTFSVNQTFGWLLFFLMFAGTALIIRYAWKSKQKA